MKILLSGATGYIGKRLLPILLDRGHEVICMVRSKQRFSPPVHHKGKIKIVEWDLLDPPEEKLLPDDIDAAYYLVHSMSSSRGDFSAQEATTAQNFRKCAESCGIKQLVYLSGIVNEDKLSKHLESRFRVEKILTSSDYALTVLRAGIIVGSGSASFEIIRDLVEKLPVMVAPKWLLTRSQPIGVRDVLSFLSGVLLDERTYNQSFDIGGPDVLTYKQMLLQFAEVRGLKRKIIIVPVMTPRLSSYWLYFVTATTYSLAVRLVDSMKVEVVARKNHLAEWLGIKPMTYKEAIQRAFDKIEQNVVVSSWKDALVSGGLKEDILPHIHVPEFGCFKNQQSEPVPVDSLDDVMKNIWSLGGQRGWYYGNLLWRIRGWLDKLVGGVGLRRGRTSPDQIHAGDALDFWRVLLASKSERRLLLYAEMKLPGEAWLEFKVREEKQGYELVQTATFRPRGLGGRMYWYVLTPFHYFIFRGMCRNIAKGK